jgi:hypothetical protein
MQFLPTASKKPRSMGGVEHRSNRSTPPTTVWLLFGLRCGKYSKALGCSKGMLKSKDKATRRPSRYTQ